MNHLKLAAISFVTSTALAGSAYAQVGPTNPPSGQSAVTPAEDGITDVVVYGQRKSAGESAQKVPIAITAIDANTLAAQNTVNITDIGALAPNVQTASAGTTPGLANFSIRGIGVNASVRSVDPAVNVLQDGMVISYLAGSLSSTFDLESAEVLRGPQGVLFGRNATGGAISLRTRRPGSEFKLLTDVSYGNFNTLNANASVEGRIIGDAVLGKIAVLYRRSDGFMKNTLEGTYLVAPGNPTGTPFPHKTGQIGALDEFTIKPTFVFKLGSANTLTVFGQYQHFNDDGSYPRNFVPTYGATVPLQTVFGYYPTYEGYKTNVSDPGYLHLREGHVIAELVNEIGAAKLTTIAAWRHITYNSSVDFYGGPIPLFTLPDNIETNRQYSIESRLNVPLIDDRLELTAGAFYLNYTTYVVENRRRLTATAAAPYVPVYTRGTFDQTTNAIAGYLNLDWHIGGRLTLSAGGRYSSDKKDFTGAPTTTCVSADFSNCPQTFTSLSKRWNKFSPRAVANFQVTDHVLAYASYTQGFRSGNFNSRVTVAAGFQPANPETVSSYEVGLKSDLLGRTLRVNIAGFVESYRDIQQVLTLNVPGAAPVQTLINAATARISGVEAEFIAQPIRALRFEANFGYTDARFTSFTATVPGVADPTTLKFPRIPQYTVTVAANTTIPMASGKVEGRVAYDYRSAEYSDLPNNPLLRVAGYGLLNANLTYVARNWSIGIFGRNIGNVDYAEDKGLSSSYVEWGGQPRTFGVRFTTSIQ